MRAIHIDELRKEREKEFAFVDDKHTEPLDKLLALRELQKELYKKEGYTGKLPELNLTDEPNSFAVDGKNGEAKKIFISLNDLNNGKASVLLYAHENAHLVDYDKGEEIAKYAETKIGENNPKNKFTEKEKAEYKKKLRETVKIDKSLEQQFAEARSIDKNDRENHEVIIFEGEVLAQAGGLKTGLGVIYNKDLVTNKEEYGYVVLAEPQIGVLYLPSAGIGVKQYSKPGASIKEFEGFYGTIRGIGGNIVRVGAEMEINGINDVNWNKDISVGAPTFGFLAGIGYRKVIVRENLSETEKNIIKNLTSKETNIKEKLDTILHLKDMIEYNKKLGENK